MTARPGLGARRHGRRSAVRGTAHLRRPEADADDYPAADAGLSSIVAPWPRSRTRSALREQLEAESLGRSVPRRTAPTNVAGRPGRDDVAADRQRVDDLRAQIDVLNAEMVVMRAEADRALAEERLRADRLERAGRSRPP